MCGGCSKIARASPPNCEEIQSLYAVKRNRENRLLQYRGTMLHWIEEGKKIEKKDCLLLCI
jgi:hypothetical protein